MNARAVADTPPVISSMTPRSQVISATKNNKDWTSVHRSNVSYEMKEVPNMAENRIDVVKKICRCWLKDSCEKKNCSITYCGISLQNESRDKKMTYLSTHK